MPGPDHLTVTIDQTPTGPVVRCVGELDAATVPLLEEAVEAVGPAATVGFDLTDVTFIDSSGIRVLATAAHDLPAAGGSARVVGASPVAQRLLTLTGLDDLLVG